MRWLLPTFLLTIHVMGVSAQSDSAARTFDAVVTLAQSGFMPGDASVDEVTNQLAAMGLTPEAGIPRGSHSKFGGPWIKTDSSGVLRLVIVSSAVPDQDRTSVSFTPSAATRLPDPLLSYLLSKAQKTDLTADSFAVELPWDRGERCSTFRTVTFALPAMTFTGHSIDAYCDQDRAQPSRQNGRRR